MEWIASPEIWIAFFTLFALEVVLGIDNVIFISILAGKLPQEQQARARTIGLSLALITRLLLLLSLAWIARLTSPLFVVLEEEISGRDLILILGGLFLLYKASTEIFEKFEAEEGHKSARVAPTFAAVIVQILLIDIVFSLDSVITAVGMVDEIGVMVAAVIGAIIIMLLFAGVISDFVNRHPSIKMLALSFLLLIGTILIAEGFDQHIPKGYIYFALAFSVMVEALNIRTTRTRPVKMHHAVAEAEPGDEGPGAR